jgi:hypothetical protein
VRQNHGVGGARGERERLGQVGDDIDAGIRLKIDPDIPVVCVHRPEVARPSPQVKDKTARLDRGDLLAKVRVVALPPL